MLVTHTNLDIYITDVRLYVGDMTEPYVYSDSVIMTALVNAVKYLSNRWDSKYLIYSSGIVSSFGVGTVDVNTPHGICTLADTIQENDAFRNCHIAFNSVAPPVIEQQDSAAIVLAASYLLRRSSASSSYTGLSWSTPDLSYSNIQTSKSLQEYIAQDLAALNAFFMVKLGRMQVGRLAPAFDPITLSIGEQINWYTRLAEQSKFNR